MQISVSLIFDMEVKGRICFLGVLCGLLINICVMPKKREDVGPWENVTAELCLGTSGSDGEEFHCQKQSLTF